MKKYHIITTLLIGLTLNGCGNSATSNLPEANISETAIAALSNKESFETKQTEAESTEEESSIVSTAAITSTEVIQGGPYGKISISVPNGWNYDTYPVDSDELMVGMYGIRFYPKDVTTGYIELAYTNNFGVCGTGLDEKQTTIGGNPACVGTYDNHVYWDFISFQEDYAGVVALTYYVEDWWDTYSSQVKDILNTIQFDPNIKEGSVYIYSSESEEPKIGLSVSLKKVSPAGATFVFHQYDPKAPTGELNYGEDYVIEVQKNNTWEPVPVIIENYAFNQPAYLIIPNDTSEQEICWDWLYGTLKPGNYRIKKTVSDFRGTGDYDNYTLCANFLIT